MLLDTVLFLLFALTCFYLALHAGWFLVRRFLRWADLAPDAPSTNPNAIQWRRVVAYVLLAVLFASPLAGFYVVAGERIIRNEPFGAFIGGILFGWVVLSLFNTLIVPARQFVGEVWKLGKRRLQEGRA